MFALLNTLLLLALALCVSGAVVDKRTNAARLAHGQPPLPPRVLFDASKVDSAPHAKRSAMATFDCTGHTITTSSGNTLATDEGFCCVSSATDTYGEGLDAFGCIFGESQFNSPVCSSGLTAYCCSDSRPNGLTVEGLQCGLYASVGEA